MSILILVKIGPGSGLCEAVNVRMVNFEYFDPGQNCTCEAVNVRLVGYEQFQECSLKSLFATCSPQSRKGADYK